MFKEAITTEPLQEQLRRRAVARLLRSRLQVNAAFCVHQAHSFPEVVASLRSDPARLPPAEAERLGRLTIGRILFAIAALSAIGMAIAMLSFAQCAHALDRLGPKPTCAQCQLAEPRTAIVRGTDTIGTIVEFATLPPERDGQDSLRMYRARLRRGESIGGEGVVATTGGRGHLELRSLDSTSGTIVGRLFIEGVDHSIPVHIP
jgi:hypothetical protein